MLPSTWAWHGNITLSAEHFPPDGYTLVEGGDPWFDRDHNTKAKRQNNYNEWVSSRDALIVDSGRNRVWVVEFEQEIEGVWDLTMRGGERNYVYGLCIGKTSRSIHPNGVQCLGE